MGRGRKLPVLTLTDADREMLRGWSVRRKTAQALALRSRIVVRAVEGGSAATIRWLVRHPRYHVHFTPTSASWLNQVERFFAALTEKQIRRASFRSTQQLEAAIRQYLQHHNAQPKPFLWTKSADDILTALAKYCERTNDSVH